MQEYIRALGAAIILSALLDMLVPEGGFKKYCRLVCGFMVAAVMLSPLTGGLSLPEWDGQSPDMEAAEAQARARILMQHKSNLEEILRRETGAAEAYAEVDGEGNVTRVTLDGVADEASAREYVKNEMGIEGSGVRINENKAAADG